MASNENHLSSPTAECAEPRTEVSSLSTIIPMTSNTNPSMSAIQNSMEKRPADNYSEFHHDSTRKQTTKKEISGDYLRRRLCRREFFLARLTLVSNTMSFLGIFGIVLMIIANELTFGRVDNEGTKATWFIKLIITLSTVILIVLIFYYHYLDMIVYAYRNLLEDWRIELTLAKIFTITLEVLICIIHPMPRSYPYTNPQKINSITYPMSYASVDVALGLPMFLRFYLLGRTIMMHSPMIRDIPLRSLGYITHVSINSYFLIKSYLEQWPIQCLFTFSTIVFLIGSWALRACDYKPTGEHISMSDSMWLFIITAATVGYGDIYPTTYCGRSIAAIISLFGLLLSALLIALIAQKLQLTREQKYVNTFVLNTQLKRQRKNQASNVIKYAIKSWYLKRRNKSSSIEYFQVQQKLFESIRSLQKTKWKQRKLVDSCVGFPELITVQRTINVQTEETLAQMVAIKTEVKNMKQELNSLNHNMNTLQNTLNILLNKL